MPPQITCACALPGKTGKHENHTFHTIGLCYTYTRTMHLCAVFLKEKKCHYVTWLIASNNIAEIVRYPINTVHWLLLQAWRRTTPIFYTATDTVWQTWLIQSMWVTDSRMLCSLSMSCLLHPIDRFGSEGWFCSDQVIFMVALCNRADHYIFML